jgi:hypothetical protein
VTAAMGPFQFGLNISTLNPCTDIIKSFILNDTFMFRTYHEKRDLFHTMEGYLKGNESKFSDAMYEMDNIRSRYVECRMLFDNACIEEIEEKRQIRQKDIMARFNMTIEEYIPFVSILSSLGIGNKTGPDQAISKTRTVPKYEIKFKVKLLKKKIIMRKYIVY